MAKVIAHARVSLHEVRTKILNAVNKRSRLRQALSAYNQVFRFMREPQTRDTNRAGFVEVEERILASLQVMHQEIDDLSKEITDLRCDAARMEGDLKNLVESVL